MMPRAPRPHARTPRAEPTRTAPVRTSPTRSPSGPAVLDADLLTLILACVLVMLVGQQVLGGVGLIATLGVTGAIGLLHRHALPAILLRGLPLLAFGVWALSSGFWSAAPDVSFRYGTQLLLTIGVAIVLAETVPISRFPLVLFVGCSVLLLLSIANGRQGISDTGPVLIGLVGSKNQFGYLSLLTVLSCYGVIANIGRPPALFRLGALAILPIAIVYVGKSHAAAAQVQLLLGTAMFLVLMWSIHVSRSTRIFLVSLLLIASSGLVIAAPQIEEAATYIRRDVLKKDATLTGRTELWAQADLLIEQRPVLGWGYRSTWLGSSPTSIGLLRAAGLLDGRGFNFHNLLREMRVDLGIVGATILMLLYAFALVKLALAAVLRPKQDTVFVFVLFTLIGVVRAFTEMNVGPFLADTVMIFATISYATRLTLANNESDQQVFADRQARAGLLGRAATSG